MANGIRGIVVLTLVMGIVCGCGGERITMSSGSGEQNQPVLSKVAVGDGIRAIVVATVLREDTPVNGATVEFSRAVSGRASNFQWSGVTDSGGQVRIEIAGSATGYYRARAFLNGTRIGRWSSIPINGGYRSLIDLPVRGKAQVTGKHQLTGLGETAEQATAMIGESNASGVTGKAVFTRNGDNITFVVELNNASAGQHAVHIHEKGDCSAPDGTSAGGHWNPTGVAHGKWGEGEFHLGDIGNLTADEQGAGRLQLTTNLWEMNTGSDIDVVGKAIVVHAGPDDFVSQPSGNAGARIGCGVIKLGR